MEKCSGWFLLFINDKMQLDGIMRRRFLLRINICDLWYSSTFRLDSSGLSSGSPAPAGWWRHGNWVVCGHDYKSPELLQHASRAKLVQESHNIISMSDQGERLPWPVAVIDLCQPVFPIPHLPVLVGDLVNFLGAVAVNFSPRGEEDIELLLIVSWQQEETRGQSRKRGSPSQRKREKKIWTLGPLGKPSKRFSKSRGRAGRPDQHSVCLRHPVHRGRGPENYSLHIRERKN